MTIVIVPNEKGLPAGKLADAEIHFTEGPLAGLKLTGFSVWESQWAGKGRHAHLRCTMPSREYEKNGERRRWDLVRPIDGDPAAADAIKAAILDAFEHDEPAVPVAPPVAKAEILARQTWRQAQAAPTATPRPAPAQPRRSAPRRPVDLDDVPF